MSTTEQVEKPTKASKKQQTTVQEAGQKGGEATREKVESGELPADFYSRIGEQGGSIGGSVRGRSRAPERMREEYQKSGKIPMEYQKLVQHISNEHKQMQRNCSKYVPQMFEILTKAGIPDSDARLIVQADAEEVWAWRTVLFYMPGSAKNAAKAAAGKAGGRATAASTTKPKPAPTPENTASAAPEPAAEEEEEEARRFTIDLTQWKAQLLKSIEKAEQNGSNVILLEFSKIGQLDWVEAGHGQEQVASAAS